MPTASPSRTCGSDPPHRTVLRKASMTTRPETGGLDGDWRIYRGDSRPHDRVRRLPPPPPWRRFSPEAGADGRRERDLQQAISYRPDESVIDRVNAAILLRRPLLVTGGSEERRGGSRAGRPA